MFTIENFKKGLSKIFKLEDNENLIKIKYFNYDDNKQECELTILNKEVQNIIDNIPSDATFNDYMLCSKNFVESSITEQERKMFPLSFHIRSNLDLFKTSHLDFNFSLSSSSQQYVIAMLCYFGGNEIKEINLHIGYLQDINNLEQFCQCFNIYTVTLQSNNEIINAKKYLRSYLFNVSLSFDCALVLSCDCKNERFLKRKVKRNMQLFPYKDYNIELIKYYNQGISSNMPFVQYLAFYHVIEFFFKTVSEEDMIDFIKETVSRPNFTPNNNAEIKSFYEKLRSKYISQRNDDVQNEKNALKLCLIKYVKDIDQLKNTIKSIDANIIPYYENNSPSFIDEKIQLNFEAPEIASLIRNRIYSVRNAVVHSKEGEKSRYEPYHHDKELAKEVPLIRAIAEEVIINSANEINYSI